MPAKAIEIVVSTKVEEANAIIKSNLFWSMGAGLVPVPFLDIAGIAGVQIKMLFELSKLYGVKFSENRVKSVLASLIGSAGTGGIATGAVASLIKVVPVVGTFGGVLALPVVAGASTYAVGKVFVQHFESGGTFLDFDPAKTKQYFAEQFKEGQKLPADLKEASK